jgi:hypothetical protein
MCKENEQLQKEFDSFMSHLFPSREQSSEAKEHYPIDGCAALIQGKLGDNEWGGSF